MTRAAFAMKQFTVQQQFTAMPVCTDACVFGAWVRFHNPATLLDLGTGTGLLSLMMAQNHSSAIITAIDNVKTEIDQAKLNFQNSPYHKRLIAQVASIQSFTASIAATGIICNPPYFLNKLPGNTSAYNHARHTNLAFMQDLLQCIHRNLANSGTAYILLPASEHALWLSLFAQFNLHQLHTCKLQSHQHSAAHLHIYALQHIATAQASNSQIVYYGTNGKYTPELVQLLQPFYSSL